jgi:drug/metabolite transporter (DMT)-like permease
MLKIASICLFVVMMICIKLLQNDIPIGEIIFTRALLGMMAVAGVYKLRGQFTGRFEIRSVRAHSYWALSASMAMIMWFIAITLIPLPDATAIGFAMPLLVVAMAYFVLGETVRIVRWIAILTGLVGVCIIVWPSLGVGANYGSTAAIGAALALGAAFFWALAQALLRRLTRTETSGSAVLSFSIATMFIALLSLPFGWSVPSASQWGLILLCGVAGGFGQLCVAESLRFAEASALAPFEYLAFPVASLAAIVIFGEYPDKHIWLGLPLVVAGGLLVIWREHQLAKRAKQT